MHINIAGSIKSAGTGILQALRIFTELGLAFILSQPHPQNYKHVNSGLQNLCGKVQVVTLRCYTILTECIVNSKISLSEAGR